MRHAAEHSWAGDHRSQHACARRHGPGWSFKVCCGGNVSVQGRGCGGNRYEVSSQRPQLAGSLFDVPHLPLNTRALCVYLVPWQPLGCL